jgi:hypothetical protein
VGHTTGVVTSNELSYLLRKGLELRATYDFLDPDWNLESGAQSRAGGGIFVMPKPFVTVEALFRSTMFDSGVALSGEDYWETVLQLHLLY